MDRIQKCAARDLSSFLGQPKLESFPTWTKGRSLSRIWRQIGRFQGRVTRFNMLNCVTWPFDSVVNFLYQLLYSHHCGPRANENFATILQNLYDSKNQTIIDKVLLENDGGN